MARRAAKDLNVTLNSVAIEDELNKASQKIKQELPVVTAFADAGPRVVAGNYDYTYELGGSADFAASQGDATIFALINSAGVSLGVDPTGATAAAGDPNYDSTVCLSEYTLEFATGGAAQYSVTLQGNSALTRAVA
jgi:hypothetical protein